MPTTPSLVRRAAGASARRPRLTLALWLLFVALHRVAGGGTALDREVVAEIVQARAADQRPSMRSAQTRPTRRERPLWTLLTTRGAFPAIIAVKEPRGGR